MYVIEARGIGVGEVDNVDGDNEARWPFGSKSIKVGPSEKRIR